MEDKIAVSAIVCAEGGKGGGRRFIDLVKKKIGTGDEFPKNVRNCLLPSLLPSVLIQLRRSDLMAGVCRFSKWSCVATNFVRGLSSFFSNRFWMHFMLSFLCQMEDGPTVLYPTPKRGGMFAFRRVHRRKKRQRGDRERKKKERNALFLSRCLPMTTDQKNDDD